MADGIAENDGRYDGQKNNKNIKLLKSTSTIFVINIIIYYSTTSPFKKCTHHLGLFT